MKPHNGMRPQDVVVLLKIVAKGSAPWYNKDLAGELFMSSSEVTESLNRSMVAGLLDNSRKKVFTRALLDLLVYGLKYVYPVQPGAIVRGLATAHAALPLRALFSDGDQYVWPDAGGTERGQAVEPLYPTVARAAKEDAVLYELLTLVDALRVGRTREVKAARELLEKRLKEYSSVVSHQYHQD